MNAITTPIPFLQAVAEGCAAEYDDLSNYCFVFPNKRSGTFFLNHLAQCYSDAAAMAPEVMSIADFAVELSGLDVASHTDLVFRLYRIYMQLAGEGMDADAEFLEFDRFLPWAEIMLSDFSEVDQYDIDADMLYANLSEYRKIETNYLSPEQVEVIERYFGYSPQASDVEGFWKTLSSDSKEEMSEMKKKFLRLWELLGNLYHRLRDELAGENLALGGTTFRRALDRLRRDDPRPLRWDRVVFVGFSAPSTTEYGIFGHLKKMRAADGQPYALFFWDATGPVLSDAESGVGRDMARNMKNYPMPAWAEKYLEQSAATQMPGKIRILASPSNSAQAKIAGRRIGRLMEEGVLPTYNPAADRREERKADAEAAKVAVVLPDENMLLPLLYSLPEQLPSVNLTMGYSLRYTAVASFMHHLRMVQSRRRRAHGEEGFFHEDFAGLMSHPLTHVVASSKDISSLNGYINKHHKYVITPEEVKRFSQSLFDLLDTGMAPDETTAAGAVGYLDRVLCTIDSALERTDKDSIERAQIFHYRMALSQLLQTIQKYGYRMRSDTVFRLVDRLLAMERVSFEGEPLKGLQIMGMLETRALDFTHLIVLSLNDSILPRKASKRTFIPDKLRVGYGLPISYQSENLYAYYFYRLLSRASDVTLIYDARAGEGMRSGGKSRFLSQLELLHARGRAKEEAFRFEIDVKRPEAQEVEKNPTVVAQLSDFLRKDSGRNFSASALKKYLNCPVQFYYSTVCGINDDPEPSEYIDPITQGNIFHNVMETLYVPQEELRNKYLKERIHITADYIYRIVGEWRTRKEGSLLRRAMTRAVNKEHFHLPEEKIDRPLSGAARLVADRLEKQVAKVLEYDRKRTPFNIIGTEIKGTLRYPFGRKGEMVNMRYALDRVDEKDGEVRIVDYKTGSVNMVAKSMEAIFHKADKSDDNRNAGNIFQLLLYADFLAGRMKEEEGIDPGDIALAIYDANKMEQGEAETPVKYCGKPISGHLQLKDEFDARLDETLTEIFDDEIPFQPTRRPDDCSYCRLKALCGKE